MTIQLKVEKNLPFFCNYLRTDIHHCLSPAMGKKKNYFEQ